MKLISEEIISRPDEMIDWVGKHLKYFELTDKISLVGLMGSGKTFMTKSLLRGWGCQDWISSPTFTLVNEYTLDHSRNKVQIKHIDLYRLMESSSAKSFNRLNDLLLDIPLIEILTSSDLVFVEWGNTCPELNSYFTKRIELDLLEDDYDALLRRKIKIYS